jgi:ribosome-binding protein aMBF1 (putative translation factor)
MEELLLPGLLPDDPQNRLSKSARQRVIRAQLESERIRWEAEAKIEARRLSEEKERQLRNQADLKGVRTVLRVLAVEYDAAGFSLREYWDAMREEIESAANSLSLYSTQRRLLQVEFHRPPDRKPPRQNPSAVPLPAKPPEESVGAQIRRLRDECQLTTEELAEEVEMEVRSVQRHLANKATPYVRHFRAYERVFSKLLSRKVVISKMS